MKRRKHSLAIISIYDPDGIISDAVIYYASALMGIAKRMIVSVNGDLAENEEKKIRKISNEIYRRPNTGFDFGAYKDVLQNYLKPGELEQYQELILCNDTCYGPFVPFTEIFARMGEKNAEFWSINYIEDPLLPHFQSYFMVASGRGIGLVRDFLLQEVDSCTTDSMQACGYEHGLSERIISSGIRADYYTSCVEEYHDLDVFGAPDYAIELLGFPLLKRRAFSDELSVKDNCRRALCMIAEQGRYPVSYILDNVNRIYNKDFSKALQKQYITQISYFEKNYASREDVIAFCRKHKKVYIYGNGYMAALFMARFKRYMNEFGGYVVSDEYYEETESQNKQTYKLSQIGVEEPMIVAMTEKVAVQIVNRVRNRDNILFLSIDLP